MAVMSVTKPRMGTTSIKCMQRSCWRVYGGLGLLVSEDPSDLLISRKEFPLPTLPPPNFGSLKDKLGQQIMMPIVWALVSFWAYAIALRCSGKLTQAANSKLFSLTSYLVSLSFSVLKVRLIKFPFRGDIMIKLMRGRWAEESKERFLRLLRSGGSALLFRE